MNTLYYGDCLQWKAICLTVVTVFSMACSDKQKEAKVESNSRFDMLLEEFRKFKNRPPEAELQKALSKLNLEKTVDDVLGVTWYKQPYFKHYSWENDISIYLGDNGTRHWLRLKMSYGGDDWIFFKKAYLSYDGNTKEVLFDKYEDKKTDMGYVDYRNTVTVWEWIDVPVTESVEKFLREFAKSTNAKMRLSGKYARTLTLTTVERKGILDVLDAYDIFNGTYDD